MRSTIATLACTTGPGLGLGCIDDDSGHLDESTEGDGDGDGDTGDEDPDTGNGDGDGDGDGGDEQLGEPLDHAAYCPDVEAPLLQPFIPGGYGQLGACGDLLMHTDPFGGNDRVLFPVDGEPEQLPPIHHRLSPRGRVLLSQNFSAAILTVREFGQAEKHTLDLIVDGERTTLVAEVNCATVATSKMHSQLVVATLEQEVLWVDTDAVTITPTSLAGFEYVESDSTSSTIRFCSLPTSSTFRRRCLVRRCSPSSATSCLGSVMAR